MAYVATVTVQSGGKFTGTSLVLTGGTLVLTGSLATVSPDGFTSQYAPSGATTANIPLQAVSAITVA